MSQHRKIALIGDVGGTNIRLQLIAVDTHLNEPAVVKETIIYDVAKFHVFQEAIEEYLSGLKPEDYPTVAVIAIAGPISDNTVFLANVGKWDTINGNAIGQNLKIPHFQLLNDFEAASYGVLLVPQTDFVSINGLPINPNKTRGIIGPGTGLGNSVLFPVNLKDKQEIIVIPSEGGHTDFPAVDEETKQFNQFFIAEGIKENKFSYASLERSFCGPSLPYMFRFFAKKYPEDKQAKEDTPTSQKIIQVAMKENPPRIYDLVFNLFVKIYSIAVSNFVAQHLTPGGMYLVGSLTKSCIPRLVGLDMFKSYVERHPEVKKMVEKVPVVACLEKQLGLKGAFFFARRIFIDN